MNLNRLGRLLSCILAMIFLAITGCSGLPIAPIISPEPQDQVVAELQTATFSVKASGTPPLHYQWLKNDVAIAGATSASYTTPRTTLADSGEKYEVIVANSAGTANNAATLTVNPGVDVPTFHYDNSRSGQNLRESILKPQLVNQLSFGKLGTFKVDGKVDAQPLYLSKVAIPNIGSRNVLYVATEHGTVFAFDADSAAETATILWKTSTPLTGESPSDDRNCEQVTPEIGITATPVIDRSRGAIYVVAMSKSGDGNYFQRLHALDLGTGKELFGGPTTIAASYPGTGDNSSNGIVGFDPKQYKERAGLVEVGGSIFTTWASHCDRPPYTSWVIAFSADSLAQTGVLNLVPNGQAGGIWMSDAAPAVDSTGNMYLIVGNGDFDLETDENKFPINANCGNCFVKMSTTAPLTLLDYFTPLDTTAESEADLDFGSGGPLLLPDVVDATGMTRHLAVGAGKSGNIYVVDRDNMGKFDPDKDNMYQKIGGQLPNAVFGKPSYFNGVVYIASVGDSVRAFPIMNGKLAEKPSSLTSKTYSYPGSPVITGQDATYGIVWVMENTDPAVLHAYDATNLATEFYNSSQAANGRDQIPFYKYITPVVVNGKVYVGSSNTVEVFGLLP